MKTCTRCILNDNYPGLTFNHEGECNFCRSYTAFSPIGEDKLLAEIENAKALAKRRNVKYDVLVPLSGGKDSTYMLYLAAKKYKLRVLAMTYNNGFLSEIALRNIRTTVKNAGADHVFYEPDQETLRTVYQTMFKYTGDVCGACDIGTNTSILKVSADYRVPMIFSGVSPLENDSFVPDSIQDTSRFKYIMRQSGNISREKLNEFLIYPRMDYFRQSWYKRVGKFGLLIFPLFYIDNPFDKEMGDIIKSELGWEDSKINEYTKHFDCIAEPFTNYVRNHIYGYERRICQYSNMVRRGEITREKAFELFESDNLFELPAGTEKIQEYLGVKEGDLKRILSIQPLKYENRTSRMNKIFALMKKSRDRLSNFKGLIMQK